MNTPEGKIFRFVRPVAPEIFICVFNLTYEHLLSYQLAIIGSCLSSCAGQMSGGLFFSEQAVCTI